jgi:hypothetical protein
VEGRGGFAVYVCKYSVTGFQSGRFPWFPDRNTIVFIHEIVFLQHVPHFSRKVDDYNGEYQVTNDA